MNIKLTLPSRIKHVFKESTKSKLGDLFEPTLQLYSTKTFQHLFYNRLRVSSDQ